MGAIQRGLVATLALLSASAAHGAAPLALECRGANSVYELYIDFGHNTFNVLVDGVIDEDWDRELSEVSRERIVLYDSFGGSPMYVDRVAGTYVRMREVTPCVRTAKPLNRDPLF